jgi:2-polyprenyl-6-methoxyphenol hydroxylase-like FAD-dependent oxidoreductase
VFNNLFGVKEESTEVLVVGGGPVGLWIAVLLSERGIPFKIIDKEWRSGRYNYALTLHSPMLKMLGEVGLLDEVLEHGHRIDTIGLYDGSVRQVQVDLSKLSTQYPFLIVLPQSYLEELLERKIRKQGGKFSSNRALKDFKFGANDDRTVTSTVDKLGSESSGYSISTYEIEIEGQEEVTAQYVIGADGYDSTVRRKLEIPFDQVGPQEIFAAIEFETDVEMGSEARFTIAQSKRSMLWPLPGGRCRGIFQMDPNEVNGRQQLSRIQNTIQIGGKSFPRVPDAIALDLVKNGAPSFSGKIGEIDWSMIVRFERRLAHTFGKNSIWLCGDSARTTGPIGVQSINAGFVEAHELVSRISQVRSAGYKGFEEALSGYGQKYLSEWKDTFANEGKLQCGEKVNPWIAAHLGHWLSDLPATGSELEQLLGRLDLRLPNAQEKEFSQAG